MPSLFPMTDAAAKPCPVCRKPRNQEFRPFCSSRCRDRDLNNWFSDNYTVPGRFATPEELTGED